jgi:ParB-like chromosome segregation protein Spo0J
MFHPGLDDLLVDIDSVCQHPANYNNGDLDAITASIETNGMYRPLYVQASTGQILAGNHTWAACKALGATLVPVVTLDVDDHTAKRIMLADNRTAALWELFSVRLPPQTLAGFRTMTEAAVGDRERFELLMRLAGWKPNKKERQ